MQKRGELMVPQHFLQPPSAPVAIATCSEVVGKESDDLRVIEALRRRGVAAVHAVWDDPEANWSSFALVVIRSTWDYPERRDEFLAWAKQLPTVLNPWPILRWNTDKRYLDDRAGLDRLAVLLPALTQPGQAEGPVAVEADEVRLLAPGGPLPLVEAARNHQAMPRPKGTAEGGLRRRRFEAGVHQTIPDGRIVGPGRDEAPAQEGKLPPLGPLRRQE